MLPGNHTYSMCVVNQQGVLASIFDTAQHALPRSAMVWLYYNLVYPYIMYCNEVWNEWMTMLLYKVTMNENLQWIRKLPVQAFA